MIQKMQGRKPTKMRQVYLSIEEGYIDRLKKVTTHHGQQVHEMRVAVIERIEKLERQQAEENEKLAG